MFEFVIPKFSFNHVHNMLVHFPICIVFLLALVAALTLKFKDSEFYRKALSILSGLMFLSAVTAVVGGFYTATSMLEKYFVQPAWVQENAEFVEMFKFHRMLGIIIAVLSLISFIVTSLPEARASLKVRAAVTFVISLIMIALIGFNSHLGANLGI